MSDLTPGQKNHLRDCALTSFEHMDAAVERILAEQETRIREEIAAELAEHEPVLGMFAGMPGIVGCSCLSARDYRAAGFRGGLQGHREHVAASIARRSPDTERAQFVHISDRTAGDETPLCWHEYAGHESPCVDAGEGRWAIDTERGGES